MVTKLNWFYEVPLHWLPATLFFNVCLTVILSYRDHGDEVIVKLSWRPEGLGGSLCSMDKNGLSFCYIYLWPQVLELV